MSRLDYITIIIVGLCLLVLVYLLIQIAHFNEPVAEITSPVRAPDSSALIEKPALIDHLATTSTDSISNPNDSLSTPKNDAQAESPGKQAEYMVIAASFNSSSMAEQELKRYTARGYTDAEIGYFNRGKIVSVIVGRFGNAQDAQKRANEINTSFKIDAYVQRKRLE